MKFSICRVLTLCILLSGWACNDQPTLEKTDLMGFWEVVSASRDGQDTETLNGARFIIEETEFTTDMTGEENTLPYSFLESKITTEDGVEYEVNRARNDSLVLSFVIRDMNFKVELVKLDKNQ